MNAYSFIINNLQNGVPATSARGADILLCVVHLLTVHSRKETFVCEGFKDSQVILILRCSVVA